jgi:hypothetical protein
MEPALIGIVAAGQSGALAIVVLGGFTWSVWLQGPSLFEFGESFDREIYELHGWASRHTLKHLAAAAAIFRVRGR